MTDPLIVIGAGGFGREVLDVVDAINAAADVPAFEVQGVIDDAPSPENLDRLTARTVPYLGSAEAFLASSPRVHYVVGVGSPVIRERIAAAFDAAGHRAATLIHPTVTRGFGVEIAGGSVICAGVRLTTNITVGRHVHVNLNATIGHDSVVGDFVSINPLASVSGDCRLGDRVLVGVAGVLLNGVAVGADGVVGGSACVVRDVAPGATVKGVPAR